MSHTSLQVFLSVFNTVMHSHLEHGCSSFVGLLLVDSMAEREISLLEYQYCYHNSRMFSCTVCLLQIGTVLVV